MVNIAPIHCHEVEPDPVISVHCICCRRRAHLECLRKQGIDEDMLKDHLFAIHCTDCQQCTLCKRAMAPQSIVEYVEGVFESTEFMRSQFVQIRGSTGDMMIECNLCRRHFHKTCLPDKPQRNQNAESSKMETDSTDKEGEQKHSKWLCFECRVCRCCNATESLDNQWYDGYTICHQCWTQRDELCTICFKHNILDHGDFMIECHECGQWVHLHCTPYTMDQILVMRANQKKTWFMCIGCAATAMQKLQLNVLEICIKNDNTGIVVRNINSVLVLRSHIISRRVTMIEFLNTFYQIWNQYGDEVVTKMVAYLCQIMAKLFNHFYSSFLQIPYVEPLRMKYIECRLNAHRHRQRGAGAGEEYDDKLDLNQNDAISVDLDSDDTELHQSEESGVGGHSPTTIHNQVDVSMNSNADHNDEDKDEKTKESSIGQTKRCEKVQRGKKRKRSERSENTNASEVSQVTQATKRRRCRQYQCHFLSSNESLELKDRCFACGSTEDAHALVICQRCAISFHSYCIRSSIDFQVTDNTGYCYDCLWHLYDSNDFESAKRIVLKTPSEEQALPRDPDAPWTLMGSHLNALHEALRTQSLNRTLFDRFCIDNHVPLWIKPLLFDPIYDAPPRVKKKRKTTKKVEDGDVSEVGLTPSIRDLSIKSDPYRSELYSATNRPDGVSKFDENDNRRCQLCRYHIDDLYRESQICGRLLPVHNDDNAPLRGRECEWVHSKCALASTDVDLSYWNGTDRHCIQIEIGSILDVSKQYKCHLCHQPGASMHCAVTDCAMSFHYPCTLSTEMYDDWDCVDIGKRPFFCNFHKIHYNNNGNMLQDMKVVDMKRDRAILFDECLIVLVDRNQLSFVSTDVGAKSDKIKNKKKLKTRSNMKQLLEVKEGRIGKMVKDRDGQIVLFQMIDSFWSYKRPTKRTRFTYESRRIKSGSGLKYKISVADDIMSTTELRGTDPDELIKKLKNKYSLSSTSCHRILIDKKRNCFL